VWRATLFSSFRGAARANTGTFAKEYWTAPGKLAIMAAGSRSRGAFRMRRLVLLLGLIGAVVAGAAHADALRFPQNGKHAFQVDLPKGWRSKADTSGGLLLVPPYPHAVIYIGILTDDKYRDQPDSAVAGEVAKIAGIKRIDSQGPARISDPTGAVFYRGTMFNGDIPAKRGLARKAKIVLVRLKPNVWAQIWIVTQPGIDAVEFAALDRVLGGLTLISEP
jgi:hypothetical protein